MPRRADISGGRLDTSKVACSGTFAAHSRSTSAGSSPSRQGSLDLEKPFEEVPAQQLYSPFYATNVPGLPEYDYPTPWSVERAPRLTDSDYPPALIVKNTFLGTKVQRPASLDGFLEERLIQSCPASGIGLPPGLEDLVTPEDAAARLVAAEAVLRRKAETEGMAESQVLPQPVDCLPTGLLDEPLNFEAPEFLPALPQQTPQWHVNGQPPSFHMPLQAPQQPVTLDLMQALSSSIQAEACQPQAFQPQPFDIQFAAPACSAYPAQISEPELGSPDFPTVGSQGHRFGNCKPCAFLYTKGCGNGVLCSFCHLCDPGEKKRRAKESRAARRGTASSRC